MTGEGWTVRQRCNINPPPQSQRDRGGERKRETGERKPAAYVDLIKNQYSKKKVHQLPPTSNRWRKSEQERKWVERWKSERDNGDGCREEEAGRVRVRKNDQQRQREREIELKLSCYTPKGFSVVTIWYIVTSLYFHHFLFSSNSASHTQPLFLFLFFSHLLSPSSALPPSLFD